MVANLTTGKKKYAQYEDDIRRILGETARLVPELLSCIDEDEDCFVPLAKAYGIPADEPGRDEIMEQALRTACTAPLHIMRLAGEALELHKELLEKGSALMISDVGVGAQCCRAALLGASLNIRINTKMMKDRPYADRLNRDIDEMVASFTAMADAAYAAVMSRIGG
jgi:formiminotetrahydrofolate cyclodeaminase